MKRIHPAKHRTVLPAVDLGGTKIAFALVDADEGRGIAREYPPAEVVKVKGRTDGRRTLHRVAELIRKGTREAERDGWTVLRLVGMAAPGLYGDDGTVDPRTVPNIPGLAGTRPARVLKGLLGKEWEIYINNDGVVQAVAAAHALARSRDYATQWSGILEESGGKAIYFGPGTGFGAGKVKVLGKNRVEPLAGSQAFFDLIVRDGETAESLIGGRGIGEMARGLEKRNLAHGKSVFLHFADAGKKRTGPSETSREDRLDRIEGKAVARAYLAGGPEAKEQAEQLLRRVGRDLATVILRLHRGRGRKKLLRWDREDWRSVRGTRLFLVAGLLTTPEGKEVILPETRRALEEAGYGSTIHIVEIERLAVLRKRKGKIGILGASLIVPEERVLAQKAERSLVVGTGSISRYISTRAKQVAAAKNRTLLIGMDGYVGIDWPKAVAPLRRRLEKDGFRVTPIDVSDVYKRPQDLERMLRPFLPPEKTFGRVFSGRLTDLLDPKRVDRLRVKLQKHGTERPKTPGVVLCFGSGSCCAPLRNLYDLLLYRDITREEITRRSSRGLLAPLGTGSGQDAGKGQPAYLAGKRYHYVDFPVLDKEKKSLLKKVDDYIDDNVPGRPKLIPRRILDEMIAQQTAGPFQLKAFHDEGVWGGQWLKKIRKLPREMVNCAWAYELMAYHMSLRLPVGKTFLEIPFSNVLDRVPDRIMGSRVRRAFKGLWPIRVNYDDSWQGGDMAIQIHPDSRYIRTRFREPLRQDESYYIMDAAPDAYVHLGLKEGADPEEFLDRVQRAEREGIPFDHRRFVNVFPARKGDLFLIPAGTVHASGKGCVVLELSSTTDRYTFHFYDYLRPDLNGKLRDIHAEHAFRMLRKYPHRATAWVKRNLIQKPRCIRRGKDWAEYVLGRRDDLVFEVRRFEFAHVVQDDTRDVPHVLSLAEGDAVFIRPLEGASGDFRLPFSETAIVPACTGKYEIRNAGKGRCRVLKTLVNLP